MRKQLTILTLVAIMLSACSDYSDHRIIIGETTSYGIFEDIKVDVGVQGKNELTYSVELLYKGELLASETINSSYKSTLVPVSIDLSKVQDKSTEFAAEIVNQNQVEIDILLSNENQKIALDSTIKIPIRPLPISQPLSVSLSNGKFDLTTPIQSALIQVRKKYPNIYENRMYRIAFLSEILKQNKKGLDVKMNGKEMKPVKKGFDINTTVKTDTVFKHTVIGRYPAFNNSYYNDINFEKMISDYIETKLDSIQSDWNGEMSNGAYVITDNLSSEYAGLIGVYLINIDQYGQFTYQQIGAYLSDAVSPKFSNKTYCSEPSNPEYEGVVCLDNKSFYGLRTSIPFVGRAYGDIDKIYINKTPVRFVLGEEIYKKVYVQLSMGYNRVPVKIVDNSGNITESYIPITMEYDDDTDINIDNNINIDNY
ncbi:hypothetical protein N8Z47_00405 [Salibacteraceae bacterium]|nr:hypothetical protein [Salibacteraceae bacterium]